LFDIGTVVARHALASIVSKVFGHAHGTQGSVVASGAVGGTIAVTGQASVWPRAFHKRCIPCTFWTFWNVPVVVLMPKRKPIWKNIAGAAIRTFGTSNAFPRVVVVVGVV